MRNSTLEGLKDRKVDDIQRNAFLVLDLYLDVLDGVAVFNLQSDGLYLDVLDGVAGFNLQSDGLYLDVLDGVAGFNLQSDGLAVG